MILYSVVNDWRVFYGVIRRIGYGKRQTVEFIRISNGHRCGARSIGHHVDAHSRRENAISSQMHCISPSPSWPGTRQYRTETQKRWQNVSALSTQQCFAASGGEFRGEESLDDVYLRRWLRARYWDVDTAAQSIRDHATWRLTYCPHDGRIQPVCPSPLSTPKAT